MAEITCLRKFLFELHVTAPKATIVYCDNVFAVYLSHNLVQHQRIKLVDIDIHFFREGSFGSCQGVVQSVFDAIYKSFHKMFTVSSVSRLPL